MHNLRHEHKKANFPYHQLLQANQKVKARQIVKVCLDDSKLGKKKRSIAPLKVDDDLSPSSKRKKVRQAAAAVMKSVTQLCESEGENLGTVLGECCLMKGNDGLDARETVKAVFDQVVKGKGTKHAFEKLLSEETWDKRVQCMRVSDWIYLLFKGFLTVVGKP